MTTFAAWVHAFLAVQDGLSWKDETRPPLLDWLDARPDYAEGTCRRLSELKDSAGMLERFVAERYGVGHFERRPPPTAKARDCTQCGTRYIPRRVDSLTCSAACRKRRSRRQPTTV